MSDRIQFNGVTVNASDALALATFYAELTRGIAKGDDHWAMATGDGGSIGFQQVTDFRPPDWPDGVTWSPMHLEFYVDDLEATERRALAAGAIRFTYQPNSDHCLVYADPAGHPFCLSTWAEPELG